MKLKGSLLFYKQQTKYHNMTFFIMRIIWYQQPQRLGNLYFSIIDEVEFDLFKNSTLGLLDVSELSDSKDIIDCMVSSF